jgi:hypothetical protein
MGINDKEHVRKNFLAVNQLWDYLILYNDFLEIKKEEE